MAKVEIDKDRCKGCGLCVTVCPVSCLEFSAETNSRGVKYVRVKRGAKCIGCGRCYLICPEACVKLYEDKR